ncbi:MAG: hypothetical protein HQ517_14040 [SAR324 cluster bacterium]|nr:hypothetical protein [SAR324 cluster bacterium]
MKFKHIVMALLGVSFGLSALYAVTQQPVESTKARADIIIIDSMKVFGALEKAVVSFPHDKHTDALEQQGKDCTVCHPSEGDKLVLKFKRTSEIDHETSLDIYHTNCINCHEERARANLKTGPVECGECHQLRPELVPSEQVFTFDASMHQRHIKAADNKCDGCHHSIDADNKKVPYIKGKEDSCRACHKAETQNKQISYRSAAHQQCINCHGTAKAQEKLENKVVAGQKCVGCHDKELLAKIAKLDKISRRDRNQPDVTFIKSFDQIGNQMMDPVVFNHKQHETVADCGNCHHEPLNACVNCHTLTGAKEGDGISLAQAMHMVDSERSCIGCHVQKQSSKECAGCHALVEIETKVSEGQACQSCHTVPIAKIRADKALGKELLAKNYQKAPLSETQIDYEQVPEEILIDGRSKQFKGVKFQHRQIIKALLEKIKGNVLAINFHQGKDVICQSCHHNSPGTNNPPPKCISCHSSAEDSQDGRVPGIKAAYHRQCFECHEKMEMEKPVSDDCIACHLEK